MMFRYPNPFQLAAGAGTTFAPSVAALEPTIPEAIEEHARAKRFRDGAIWIGIGVGSAVGLSLMFLKR